MHVGAGQDKQLDAGNAEGTDMCRHDGPAILSSTNPVVWQFIVHPSLSGLKRPDVYNKEREDSLNLCTGRPPTGVMIPDAV